MKKAKVMLASIAVCAVIGGAFAFKAHSNFNGGFFCTGTTTANVGTIPYAADQSGSTLYCNVTPNVKPTTTLKVSQNPQ